MPEWQTAGRHRFYVKDEVLFFDAHGVVKLLRLQQNEVMFVKTEAEAWQALESWRRKLSRQSLS